MNIQINIKRILLLSALILLMLAGVFCVGWISGKKYIVKNLKPTIETVVEYVTGETVRDTIYRPIVVKEIVKDSIPVYMDDTAIINKIIKDYYTQRYYSIDFSNDTIGEFCVDAVVSENTLVEATSTITPIIKTVTTTNTIYFPQEVKKRRMVYGYAQIGTSVNFKANQLQLGIEIADRYMVGLSGIRMNDKYNYTINFGVKF